jgi:DNA-binding response OmpR family regulator
LTPPGLRSPAGVHILVVEDHADTLEILVAGLETAGAVVCATASAQAAPLWVEMRPLDLIIADLGLPDVDGWTSWRRYGGCLRSVAATQPPSR